MKILKKIQKKITLTFFVCTFFFFLFHFIFLNIFSFFEDTNNYEDIAEAIKKLDNQINSKKLDKKVNEKIFMEK